MLRTARSLRLRAFDTGLRPNPFPDQAANLLPGLLTATRTGLTPASDDELTTKDHLHKVTSDPLVARNSEVSVGPRLGFRCGSAERWPPTPHSATTSETSRTRSGLSTPEPAADNQALP